MADKVLDNVFDYLVKMNQNGDHFTVSQDLRDAENPFISLSKAYHNSNRNRTAKISIETPDDGQDKGYGINFDIETHEKISANPVALRCLFGKDYAVSGVVPEGCKMHEYHIVGSLGNYADTNAGCLMEIKKQIIDLFELAESIHEPNNEYGI